MPLRGLQEIMDKSAALAQDNLQMKRDKAPLEDRVTRIQGGRDRRQEEIEALDQAMEKLKKKGQSIVQNIEKLKADNKNKSGSPRLSNTCRNCEERGLALSARSGSQP